MKLLQNTVRSVIMLMATATAGAEVLLSEDFESPIVSAVSTLQDGATYKKGQLPNNGKWVGATLGFGADRRGLIHKTFGDFTATSGNDQAMYFGYTNSGITSSVSAISQTLQLGPTYTLSFNVARDNNSTQSSYLMQLVAFDPAQNDSVRNDVRPTSSPGTVLAQVSGSVATSDLSEQMVVVFKPTAADYGVIGKAIGIRFVGNSSHPVLDNVLLVSDVESSGTESGDSDGDALPDAWELANFGDLSHDGTADSDGDGLTDAFEYANNLDPTDPETIDGIPDWAGYLDSVNSTTIFSENFESPDVIGNSTVQSGGTFSKGSLPGQWVGSSIGYGATELGLISKTFGDFSAPSGNNQGFYFGYTNSGIASSAASISQTLELENIYVLSFDVARDNNLAQSSYAMELVAYAPEQGDAVRNDFRGGLLPGTVLSSASGIVTLNDMSKRVTIVFKPNATTHAAHLGKALGIRFIGNLTHPILDNVVLKTIDTDTLGVGVPGYLTVEQWDGVPGETLADLFASEAFYKTANWIYLTPQSKSLSNVGDNYGLRMSGWLIPTISGEYSFKLAADGECRLFLSPDNKPFNRHQIAASLNPIAEEEWLSGPSSSPVALVAGNEYYIEALMKESAGNDFVVVGWTRIPPPAPLTEPQAIPLVHEVIPGTNLRSFEPDPGDLDDDGMLDFWEVLVGLNPQDNGRTDRNQGSYADIDEDGLLNYEEYQHNTNPFSVDSDNDGMPDKWEVDNDLNPASGLDANEDRDGDGLTNIEEFTLGTDANNLDSDGDGMSDGMEVAKKTNPKGHADTTDSDGDGLLDSEDAVAGDPVISWPKQAVPHYAVIDTGIEVRPEHVFIDVNSHACLLLFDNVANTYTFKKPSTNSRVFGSSGGSYGPGSNASCGHGSYAVRTGNGLIVDEDFIQKTSDPGTWAPLPGGLNQALADYYTSPVPSIDYDESMKINQRAGKYAIWETDMTLDDWAIMEDGVTSAVVMHTPQQATAPHPLAVSAQGDILAMKQETDPGPWSYTITQTEEENRVLSVPDTLLNDVVIFRSPQRLLNESGKTARMVMGMRGRELPNGRTGPAMYRPIHVQKLLETGEDTYELGESLVASEQFLEWADEAIEDEAVGVAGQFGQVVTTKGFWMNGEMQAWDDTEIQGWLGISAFGATDEGLIAATAIKEGETERTWVILLPVEIEQQNYSSSQGIRFCRWLDSFTGNSLDSDCADKDRDRFRIRIPDVVPDLTKIHIKSLGLATAVIDGQWVSKNADGDYDVTMTEENGAMVSKWMLLVSDGDDDKYYNGIGTDDQTDDQTLYANFNSPIEVTLPEYQNAKVTFHAQKPLGDVEIQPYYLSPAGDVPPAMAALITNHLEKMKEIYRQIGVRVGNYGIVGKAVPQEWFVPGSNEAPDYFTPTESNLARAAVLGMAVPGKQIRIGFVDATVMQYGDNPWDEWGRKRGFTLPGTDGIIVSIEEDDARTILGVTAHEVGHALGLEHTSDTWHRWLMRGGGGNVMLWEDEPLDSKRFQPGDFETIHSNQSFYVPN